MPNNYASHVSRKVTPQTQPVPGRTDQVQNNAGGFVFAVKPMEQLRRFLILGSEGGTYYATERELTIKNVTCLDTCLQTNADATIDLICDISKNGRAPKNAPAVFCMAYIMGKGGELSNKVAARLKEVCRIPTDLFAFVAAARQFRGMGKAFTSAIANWYNSTPADKLAYHMTKYQSRDGWSHGDLLKLCHAVPPSDAHSAMYRLATVGKEGMGARNVKRKRADGTEYVKEYPDVSAHLPELYAQIAEIQSEDNPKRAAELIRKYRAVREVIPTEMLNHVEVWEALLEEMPATALLRNLGKMTSIGMLDPLSKNMKLVVGKLNDKEFIKRGRLHPMNILMASKVYQMGRGVKGSLSWSPTAGIVQALDNAFYLGFDAVEPTGKNHMFAIDVSGSMGSSMGNSFLTCAEGAAAMAMVGVRCEPWTACYGFSHVFKELPFTKTMRLDQALRMTRDMNFGSTDASLAMTYARTNKLEVDAFVVITDNETYAGAIHPYQALNQYRQAMGRNAKLIVIGMTSSGFTIADPRDPGMLDIAGFDTTVPTVMSSFVGDNL